MTDKEKREFKDGVIGIFNGYYNGQKFNILDHTATIGSLRDNILRYIDSLQEESVVSEWKEGFELTWEDIKKIETLCFKVDIECDLEEKEYYQEVLKRFKEQKQ